MTLNTVTEQKIIAAATEVFLQRGKGGARMQEIADKAGINKALLHYYFRSKERLYDEVFRRQISAFFDELFSAALEMENIADFLHTFIHNYLDTVSAHPQVLRFVLWEIEEGGEKMVEILHQKLLERGLPALPIPRLIQRAVNRGELRPVDPVHLMMSVIGMCLYPFIARPIVENLFPGVVVNSPEFLEKRKTEIFNLVWQGIQPQPSPDD